MLARAAHSLAQHNGGAHPRLPRPIARLVCVVRSPAPMKWLGGLQSLTMLKLLQVDLHVVHLVDATHPNRARHADRCP